MHAYAAYWKQYCQTEHTLDILNLNIVLFGKYLVKRRELTNINFKCRMMSLLKSIIESKTNYPGNVMDIYDNRSETRIFTMRYHLNPRVKQRY